MRDNILPILSFHLKSRLHFIFCNHHFHHFAYVVITRQLQTLIIDLLHPTTLPSTSRVITTKTLLVLKLKGVRASVSGKSFIGLEWLHNVEHLHMYVCHCLSVGVVFGVFNRMPPTIRSVFHNLTHLELIFNFEDSFFGSEKWMWLINLLQNTPNLQTLIIHACSVVVSQ
ncbi:unnamed protein product [Vicia faba]|uniref:Uncharacterized protein n=1 Tax=Vicia faba TaxID=3906 RepID=A0AAV0ZK78_VICFA|nr:unnamed protein product [Vicia faba]